MILDEISTLLETYGIGTPGVDLFEGFLPPPGTSPPVSENAVALYEYPGESPLHVKGRKAPVHELPRVQVITRSKSYAAARTKAEEVYRLLSGYSGEIGGTGYGRITALQSPALLQRDEGARVYIVANYRIMKALSPIGE